MAKKRKRARKQQFPGSYDWLVELPQFKAWMKDRGLRVEDIRR